MFYLADLIHLPPSSPSLNDQGRVLWCSKPSKKRLPNPIKLQVFLLLFLESVVFSFLLLPLLCVSFFKVQVLKNNQNSAQDIYNGAHKKVCAWVLCESVEIKDDDFSSHSDDQIKYNPRIQPNWLLNDVDVDNEKFDTIVSDNRRLFLL